MPFSITPDPAYLYMSPRHQEALGHLLYGTGQYGGFVQLTGEVGTGKTTVVRTLLEQRLEGVDVAMIHNPRLGELEFVQTLCDELGITYARSDVTLKHLVDALNGHLLRVHAGGRRTVLIIDEAQNLPFEVLEQVRLLTNLETAKEKLLRIMLVGQPELAELLAQPNLRQLASRITARYHLTPLDETETREYIRHRLSVAGSQQALFSDGAITDIQRYSRGVPRLINILCDRALLGAYSHNLHQVSSAIVRGAVAEALGADLPTRSGADRLRNARDSFSADLRRGWGRLPQLSLSWLEGSLIALALMIAGALAYQTLVQRYAAPADSAPATVGEADPQPADLAGLSAAATAVEAPAVEPPAAAATPAAASAAAAAAPASTPATSIDELLAATPNLATLTNRLIRLWDASTRVPRGDNVCRALRRQGLECYKTNGRLFDLRQMDRPAILTLTDRTGATRYALLTQLAGQRARFELGERSVEVALADMEAAWTGELLLLWRRETVELQLELGARGSAVLWLRSRIAEMLGKQQSANPSDRFDAALVEEVRQFQEARGLIADGQVGVRSRIALSDPVAGTPTLKFQP